MSNEIKSIWQQLFLQETDPSIRGKLVETLEKFDDEDAAILEVIRSRSEQKAASDGWFTLSHEKLMSEAGYYKSVRSLKRLLSKLAQFGMIDYTPGDGNFPSTYRFKSAVKGVTKGGDTASENQHISEGGDKQEKVNEINNIIGVTKGGDNKLSQRDTLVYKDNSKYIEELREYRGDMSPPMSTPSPIIKPPNEVALPSRMQPVSRRSRKVLALRAKYGDEFDSFWDTYRKWFNEKMKQYSKNGMGGKSETFLKWVELREQSLEVELIMRGIRSFALGEQDRLQKHLQSRRSAELFYNTKLRTFLNYDDVVDGAENQEDAVANQMAAKQKEAESSRWGWWLEELKDKIIHRLLTTSGRKEVAPMWADYFNKELEWYGLQFAYEGCDPKAEVRPEEYKIAAIDPLRDLAKHRVDPSDMQRWEELLTEWQTNADIARGQHLSGQSVTPTSPNLIN